MAFFREHSQRELPGRMGLLARRDDGERRISRYSMSCRLGREPERAFMWAMLPRFSAPSNDIPVDGNFARGFEPVATVLRKQVAHYGGAAASVRVRGDLTRRCLPTRQHNGITRSLPPLGQRRSDLFPPLTCRTR